MTGSLVFVKTKNRVTIFFPGLISEAKCEYRMSCSPLSGSQRGGRGGEGLAAGMAGGASESGQRCGDESC
jgi:hypothetical protein